jgi:hypothetical protein
MADKNRNESEHEKDNQDSFSIETSTSKSQDCSSLNPSHTSIHSSNKEGPHDLSMQPNISQVISRIILTGTSQSMGHLTLNGVNPYCIDPQVHHTNVNDDSSDRHRLIECKSSNLTLGSSIYTSVSASKPRETVPISTHASNQILNSHINGYIRIPPSLQKSTFTSDTVKRSIYPSNRKTIRPVKKPRKTPPFLDYIPRSRYEKVKCISLATAKEIQDNIPSNASSFFHIMDRRIDFDSLTEDASSYELLRAWVKDDPYRVLQRKHGNLTDHVELDHQDWNVKLKGQVGIKPRLSETCDKVEPVKCSLKEVDRVNILDGNYIGKSSVMEMKKYLKEYVAQGKSKKGHWSSNLRKRDQTIMKLLTKKIPQL